MLSIFRTIKRPAQLFIFLFFCAVSPIVYASTPLDDILTQKLSSDPDDLERIYQYKLDRGAANLSIASSFLIRASKRLLQEGKINEAQRYAECALKIAPDYPPVYKHLASLSWKQNKLRIDKLCEHLCKYLKACVSRYVSAAIALTNTMLFLLFAVLLTIAVFSLVSLYKYFKLFAHDLGHLLSAPLPRHFSFLCAMLIFFFPLFLNWSIIVASFFWLLLLFVYHTRREQLLIIIFTVFFLLSPFVLQILSQLIVTNTSGLFYQTYQVYEENWDDDTARILDTRLREHPYDADALFALGLINKREGRTKEAQRLFSKLLEYDPLNCRIWCNLGNVSAAAHNHDAAIVQYSRAIELCPDSVEGYYNLSRVQLLEYMFAESNKSFNKAKKLDADRVNNYLQVYSENINRMVIDQTVPWGEFWQKTFTASDEKDRLSANLWGYFFAGIPYSCRYIVFLVFLLFVILLFTDRHTYNISLACEYCGCAVCKKCKRLVQEYKLCKQCSGIFKSTSDIMVSISRKEEQVGSIERFQGRKILIGKVLSFLLPGSGHLLFDHPFRGTAILFLFFLFVLKLLFWNNFIIDPWLMTAGPEYLGILLCVIPLGILYLYSLGHFNYSSMKLFQFLSLIRVTRKELQIKEFSL